MQNFRGTFVNKNRDAWVEINLSNLENNVSILKNYLKEKTNNPPELFAVVKADGYGHGSLMCAPTLSACGVSHFGVASIDEGIELRENKIQEPILVLGASPLWAFENAIKYDISISIFNEEHLEMAQQLHSRLNKKLKAHIKLDTGMNRIGINFENAKDFIKKVLNSNFIDLKGIFTHFADVENPKIFNRQITEFKEKGFSDEEFEIVRKKQNGKTVRAFTDVDTIANGLVVSHFENDNLFSEFKVLQEITADYCYELLNNSFDNEKAVLSVVNPKEI